MHIVRLFTLALKPLQRKGFARDFHTVLLPLVQWLAMFCCLHKGEDGQRVSISEKAAVDQGLVVGQMVNIEALVCCTGDSA